MTGDCIFHMIISLIKPSNFQYTNNSLIVRVDVDIGFMRVNFGANNVCGTMIFRVEWVRCEEWNHYFVDLNYTFNGGNDDFIWLIFNWFVSHNVDK